MTNLIYAYDDTNPEMCIFPHTIQLYDLPLPVHCEEGYSVKTPAATFTDLMNKGYAYPLEIDNHKPFLEIRYHRIAIPAYVKKAQANEEVMAICKAFAHTDEGSIAAMGAYYHLFKSFKIGYIGIAYL